MSLHACFTPLPAFRYNFKSGFVDSSATPIYYVLDEDNEKFAGILERLSNEGINVLDNRIVDCRAVLRSEPNTRATIQVAISMEDIDANMRKLHQDAKKLCPTIDRLSYFNRLVYMFGGGHSLFYLTEWEDISLRTVLGKCSESSVMLLRK